MVPLVICSIVGMAICIERLYTLNIKKIAPPHLLATVWNQLKKGEMDAGKLRTLQSVYSMWQRPVHIETREGRKPRLLSFDGKEAVMKEITASYVDGVGVAGAAGDA